MMESRLDQRCTVFRLSEAVNALREKLNSYDAVADEWVYIAPTPESSRDEGAGEARGGQLSALMRYEADVERGDVLSVTEGSDAPALFRVVTIRRPMQRHTELVIERFDGALS